MLNMNKDLMNFLFTNNNTTTSFYEIFFLGVDFYLLKANYLLRLVSIPFFFQF